MICLKPEISSFLGLHSLQRHSSLQYSSTIFSCMQSCWRTNFMGQEEDISSLYVNMRRIEMIPTYASSSPLFCYDSLFLCLGWTRWRVRLGTQLRREGKWLSKCYLQRITLLNLFSAIPCFSWLEMSEFLRVSFLWGESSWRPDSTQSWCSQVGLGHFR